MCGICGYINCDGRVSREELKTMNDTMYHRGPNDSGEWIRKIGRFFVGMAHRRLAIIDLSESGHQPMVSEDKSVVIVFNGEIYNFQSLRQELKEMGYRFHSQSDTEVLLYAYYAWGECMLQRLDGMFAFAVFDIRKEKMILARDRMGEKPLYYFWDNDTFIFASSLSPIMKYPGFKKNIRKDILSGYLTNTFILAPDTIFENTWKVSAGEYLVWEKGRLEKKTYWNAWDQYKERSPYLVENFGEAKKNLNVLLTNSVISRMVADVPVGIFLSGGIDSSLIAAIAQQSSGVPIKTFTIGFYEKEKNEAPRAKKIAEYLGTEHTELYISHDEILNLMDSIPLYFDEPFADASQIPSMLLAKLAKQKVTVALAGEGGDELFCGYKRYDWVKISQWLNWAGALGNQIMTALPIAEFALKDKLPEKERAFLNNREAGYKTQYFSSAREAITKRMVLGESKRAQHICEEDISEKNWQIRRMLVDQIAYLPDEMLQKSDKASMRYSLELRCPLLDYRVVEYSYQIPQRYKYRHGEKKYILKQLAYDKIPKKLLDMPKRGFSVPMAKWLRGPLNAKLHMYADVSILKKQELFDAEEVSRVVKQMENCDDNLYPSIVWSFYVFQMWYQTYIEDLWSNG